MLEALGLEASVERLYRLILEQPDWGVDQIAAHLGWTADYLRHSLDRLAELHLVREVTDTAGALRPISPRVGLTALLARSQADLGRQQREIEAARATIAALAEQYGSKAGDESESVERLEGLSTVRHRLEDLAGRTRTECLSFVPGGAQADDTMKASKPLDQQALERGVTIQSIYQDSFRNQPETLRYVRWLSMNGGETRTVPSLPMPLVVMDREVALVPIDLNDGRLGALELRGAGIITAICLLFEQFWSMATPWDQRPPVNDYGLTPQQQELLRLLANGDTDELASRKLGTSLRTTRRMASDVISRLGARSRFEAGVRAVQRGWL